MQRFRIHLAVAPCDPIPSVESLPEVEAESAIGALAEFVKESPVAKWSMAIVFTVSNRPSVPIYWTREVDWPPPEEP